MYRLYRVTFEATSPRSAPTRTGRGLARGGAAMVLHGGGSGDGAKNKLGKASSKKAAPTAGAALAAGLKEAQKEKKTSNPHLDALDDDSDEETDPLVAACSSGKVNAVRRALAAGADACAVGNQGLTGLFIACQNGRTEMVSVLLEGKAVVDGATPEWTPLHAAVVAWVHSRVAMR